jgi:hypothetical protein
MKTGMLMRAVRRKCCTEKLSIVGGGLLPSLGQHLPSPSIGMLPRFSMFPKPGCPCLFSPRPCSWPLNVPDGRGLKDWVGRSQQAAQVLPHAPTGRHRHPDPAVQRQERSTARLFYPLSHPTG